MAKRKKRFDEGTIAPGDVHAAVKDAMKRNGLGPYDVWKLTGAAKADRLPRTTVYEFVDHDPPRDAAISTVERIAAAVGLGLRVERRDIDRPKRANAAATEDDGN